MCAQALGACLEEQALCPDCVAAGQTPTQAYSSPFYKHLLITYTVPSMVLVQDGETDSCVVLMDSTGFLGPFPQWGMSM